MDSESNNEISNSDIDIVNINQLSILTYNVFLRPEILFPDNQHDRSLEIAEKIIEIEKRRNISIDIVVLCEVFDRSLYDLLFDTMHRNGFKYKTDVLGSVESELNKHKNNKLLNLIYNLFKRPYIINGGLIIFSKHKINNICYEIFKLNEVSGNDKLASKGFIYCNIIKNNIKHHIIGTHFTAFDTKEGQKSRQIESSVIKKFINNKNIPQDESIYICGDLNSNLYDKDNIKILFDILDVNIPKIDIIDRYNSKYSHTHENNLTGRDGFIEPKKQKIANDTLFDYILSVKTNLQPVKTSTTVEIIRGNHILRFEKPKKYFKSCCKKYIYSNELSDHYPVLSIQQF